MSLAQSIYQLTLARLVIGFASGIATVVVPVYLGEVAPPGLRSIIKLPSHFLIYCLKEGCSGHARNLLWS